MALQLRRYQNSERIVFVPAEGEPVYDLTEKRLYIGDGVTPGGNGVSGSSDSSIKQIVADLVTGGNKENISIAVNSSTGNIDFNCFSPVFADKSPTLGSNLDLNSFNITGTGSITISGSITSNQIFSNLVATDGTVLVDNATKAHVGTFNGALTGTVSGGLAGNLNLNSFTVFGNGSLQLSQTQSTLSSDSTTARLLTISKSTQTSAGSVAYLRKSRGTTVAPVAVQSLDTIGGVYGEGFDGVSYVPSSAIVYKSSGTIGANTVPGTIEFHTADSAGFLTKRTVIDHSGLLSHTGIVSISQNTSSSRSFSIEQYHSSAFANEFVLGKGRGTQSSPQSVQSGDYAAVISFSAHNGSQLAPAGQIQSVVTNVLQNGNVLSQMNFVVNSGNSMINALSIKDNGLLSLRTPTLLPAQMTTTMPTQYLRLEVNGRTYAIPMIEL